jgi:SAM-dependent methyltransferase
MWPTTERLLQRAGVRLGMRCLDFGCGGDDVSVELARLVGPTGRVTGVDMDEHVLERARALADERGVSIDFVTGRGEELVAADEYDLCYARFILCHLPDPSVGLDRLRVAARPGGVVVVEDVNMLGHVYEPYCAALARYIEIYVACARRRGTDPAVGPKLAALFLDAGLEDVDVEAVTPIFHRGEGKTIARITIATMADAAIAEGLTDRAEIDQLIDEIGSFEDDPRSILSTAQVFQVWGRKPPLR